MDQTSPRRQDADVAPMHRPWGRWIVLCVLICLCGPVRAESFDGSTGRIADTATFPRAANDPFRQSLSSGTEIAPDEIAPAAPAIQGKPVSTVPLPPAFPAGVATLVLVGTGLLSRRRRTPARR